MPLRLANRRRDSPAAEIALVFAQHRDFVRRALLVHGVGKADVDDALQQVFLVTYRRLDDYRKVDKKVAWLFMVSKLVAHGYHRGLKRAKLRAARYVPTPPPTFEEVLTRRAAARELRLVVQGLDELDRRIFLHADLEGLSAREIASEMRMNVNTVYTRLRSARQQFAFALRLRWLKERCGDPSPIRRHRRTPNPVSILYG
jgi:RNA polymerase sigma-70 factor (ECF subfamily)